MSNLMLIAHPGGHPHPHDSDWLAVIADNPVAAIALVAAAIMVAALLWRHLARRD